MQGSVSIDDRMKLYNKSDAIIFNSNWTKNKFITDLSIEGNDTKLKIIPQSTSKVKINFSKKNNLIYW